jgi:hypothetical protein
VTYQPLRRLLNISKLTSGELEIKDVNFAGFLETLSEGQEMTAQCSNYPKSTK